MRLSIPMWSGRVSPVFDVAHRLLVVDLEGGREVARREEPLDETQPARRVARLGELGVDALICGAVSGELIGLLTVSGIRVFPNVCGPVEEVLEAFLSGTLTERRFAMPGCCGRRRFRGRLGRGWCSRIERGGR